MLTPYSDASDVSTLSGMLRQQAGFAILVGMKALRAWLREKRMGQAEFGRLIGRDRFTVNRWVRGRVRPKPEALELMARMTGLDVETLSK